MKTILRLTGLIAALLLCGYSYGQQINSAEYFFDADPGVGKGTAITVSSADSVDVTGNINLTGLSAGFHTLFIRARNVNRVWSLYEGRRFYINAASTTSQVEITNAEYFFDSDPGVGNGIAVSPSFVTADSVDVTSSINTTGLSAGFHSLFVRVKNQSGVWSLYEGRRFYIIAPSTAPQVEITNAEYFIDSDPGLGNGAPIATGPAGDSIDVTSSVNTTGLPPGFHTLVVRVQNQSGVWSLYEGRRFYIIAPSTTSQVQIVNAESFFDSDPGIGNGIPVNTYSPADSVDVVSSINTSGLSSGFHSLFLRVQNQSGVWSLYEGRRFYLDSIEPSLTLVPLVKAESFFDTDPGLGNGTAVSPSFTPADSIDLFRSISANGLSLGTHHLFTRVENQLGEWSIAAGDSFNICTNAPVANFGDSINLSIVYFSDSSVNASSYEWDFGDGDTSSAQNPVHSYTAIGTYSVTLTITDACGTNSITDTVVINTLIGIKPLIDNGDGATIYPNPNNGNFMLSYHLTSANSELQIIDITGRLIYSEVIAGNEGLKQVNAANLSSGMFYWRIISDDKLTANGKIVVVR